MKNIEEIMAIIHTENNRTEINVLEEIEIMKAAPSLNVVISSKDDQFLIRPSVDRLQQTTGQNIGRRKIFQQTTSTPIITEWNDSELTIR